VRVALDTTECSDSGGKRMNFFDYIESHWLCPRWWTTVSVRFRAMFQRAGLNTTNDVELFWCESAGAAQSEYSDESCILFPPHNFSCLWPQEHLEEELVSWHARRQHGGGLGSGHSLASGKSDRDRCSRCQVLHGSTLEPHQRPAGGESAPLPSCSPCSDGRRHRGALWKAPRRRLDAHRGRRFLHHGQYLWRFFFSRTGGSRSRCHSNASL
jgi:hypothetical protein